MYVKFTIFPQNYDSYPGNIKEFSHLPCLMFPHKNVYKHKKPETKLVNSAESCEVSHPHFTYFYDFPSTLTLESQNNF